ncbi:MULTISPECIES: hypothetical protein [unclassified Streptomyces]|uniref:hypothetical protein n=1 Tax=unclassified Streptomyces TaxID=2593676 RepID=UPI00278C6CEF|nr:MULTISPECIES: hypothetical protein [unclassified Streptomyces]
MTRDKATRREQHTVPGSALTLGSLSRTRWRILLLLAVLAVAAGSLLPSAQANPSARADASTGAVVPPAPKPERIKVEELPLPPTAPSDAKGSCTSDVNPRRTGCIDADWDALQGGGFTRDQRQVAARVTFAGAPAAPDPASVYTGSQLILVRTDGSTFPGGDSWKCLTCGMPDANRQGVTEAADYPMPFADGRRLLAGATVYDCGRYRLASPACTPKRLHGYPIRWNVTADGSGKGGALRELRLHPDQVHLGFSGITTSGARLDQYGYVGRLTFNSAPKAGSPQVPRYDLTKVNRLFDAAPDRQPLRVDPDHPDRLVFDPTVPSVGELRGFSKDGREVTYVGHPAESSNIDVFAAHLTTGKVRRLTSNPEYTDPVDTSPDGRWTVALDTRGSDRQMFMAGMRDVPAVTDLLTTSAVSSVRNNHQRRFFQPYLIDRYGDRGTYQGQRLNAGDSGPGGIADPNWNAGADPQWSPDGTAVMYWQRLVSAPACGGANPLPCPTSTEPGGRHTRLMLARLVDREPARTEKVQELPDDIPWGTRYQPGSPAPVRPYPAQGTYTLPGKSSGKATVAIVWNEARTAVKTVSVRYDKYSADGRTFLGGTESVTRNNPNPTLQKLDWVSDLRQTDATGSVHATKKTSPDGFHLTIDLLETVFDATGTLTTSVGGHTYTQPANGT